MQLGQPVPKGGGQYKVGSPYRLNGRLYVPEDLRHYDAKGIASWYGELFHGRRTANGEIYDMEALTAAHPTLPLPSLARVTNLENGRSLVVRINDRGPYVAWPGHRSVLGRRLAAAGRVAGTAPVRIQYLGPAPLDGDDSYERQALAHQSWAGPRVAFAASPAKAMRYRRSASAPAIRPRLDASARAANAGARTGRSRILAGRSRTPLQRRRARRPTASLPARDTSGIGVARARTISGRTHRRQRDMPSETIRRSAPDSGLGQALQTVQARPAARAPMSMPGCSRISGWPSGSPRRLTDLAPVARRTRDRQRGDLAPAPRRPVRKRIGSGGGSGPHARRRTDRRLSAACAGRLIVGRPKRNPCRAVCGIDFCGLAADSAANLDSVKIIFVDPP